MLTTECRNIINDDIKNVKYELSNNEGKAQNVLFIVFCKDRSEKVADLHVYESFHAIKPGTAVVNIADQRN